MNFITTNQAVTLFPHLMFRELAVLSVAQPSLAVAFYHSSKGIHFHRDRRVWRAFIKYAKMPANRRKLVTGGLAWDWEMASDEASEHGECTEKWALITAHRAWSN